MKILNGWTHERIVAWLTLASVVGGGLGHYFLVDRQTAVVQEARSIDELLESMRPNMQISWVGEPKWGDSSVSNMYRVTNAGKSPILVGPSVTKLLESSKTGSSAPNSFLSDKDVSIFDCKLGLMTPGEALDCEILIKLGPEGPSVGSIQFETLWVAETALRRESMSWRLLRKSYPEDYIKQEVVKSSSKRVFTQRRQSP